MNRFIVISPNAEEIQTAVQTHFPAFNYEIAPGVWAVAGANHGPSDVCEILDINDRCAGVVFSLDAYYGFYDQALWEKLNLWEEQ